MIRFFLVFLILFTTLATIIGCESYPLGMSKDEWALLSPQEKAKATEEQNLIDAERRRVAAEERRIAAEQEAIRQEQLAQEQARYQEEIDRRYRYARFGDTISINIEGGTFRIDGKDRAYEPLAFDLIRGEAKTIQIHREDRRKSTLTVVVRASEDGRMIFFDDTSNKRLTFTEKTWDRGQTYPIELHDNNRSDPRNVTFTIRYKPIRFR